MVPLNTAGSVRSILCDTFDHRGLLPVYSQWSLDHREMRPMYLPRKIDSVTKGSAIRENFERIQFNISSCDFLRLGV